jgi:SNF family Na+-dependent transporter
MNKIIFQIGLLAFCVSAVVYAIQEMSFLDVLARSFIIFMVTIGALIGIVFVTTTFTARDKELEDVNPNPKPTI